MLIGFLYNFRDCHWSTKVCLFRTSPFPLQNDRILHTRPPTLIKLVKFLKRGKAPGPDTIHNEVRRLGTTTWLFHHLAGLFTSSIQLGYIPTAWKLVTLCMLLKPDKPITLTTSYWPISLISSIMKLFERVIEQRLRSHLEHIRFINKHQSGFRKAKSTDDHLFRLSQSIMESFNRVGHILCPRARAFSCLVVSSRALPCLLVSSRAIVF